jgi:hypothetical protein
VLLDHLAVPKVPSVVNLCNTYHQCKFQHAGVSYDTFRTPFAFDITMAAKLSSRVTIMLNPLSLTSNECRVDVNASAAFHSLMNKP